MLFIIQGVILAALLGAALYVKGGWVTLLLGVLLAVIVHLLVRALIEQQQVKR